MSELAWPGCALEIVNNLRFRRGVELNIELWWNGKDRSLPGTLTVIEVMIELLQCLPAKREEDAKAVTLLKSVATSQMLHPRSGTNSRSASNFNPPMST